MPPFARSWPELKEPTYRKRSVISTESWLTDKRIDDGAEGLWRIHDKLYDFQNFMDKHPGGAQWLEITKGTDITEAFESHHLSDRPEILSAKYFIRHAATLRNSPYTFHEHGFYRTLKRRVNKTLAALPKEMIENQSKLVMDVVVLITIWLLVMAAYWDSYKTATFAGVFLVFTAVCSHNYFHQKDSWRMHCFSLTLLSIRDWRISHVLSHHGYTNSLQDLDYASNEPFLKFTPDPRKSWSERYLSWIMWIAIHTTQSHAEFISRISQKTFTRPDLVGFTIPALLFIANGGYVLSSILMWTWIVLVCSLVYAINNFLSSHRHPKCFHEGDMPREDRDWGLAQIDATRDSRQAVGFSPLNMIAFGEHTLHHLFPNVDHSLLKYLYPSLIETCKEFDVNFELESSFQLITGEFRQLARNEPKKVPPQ